MEDEKEREWFIRSNDHTLAFRYKKIKGYIVYHLDQHNIVYSGRCNFSCFKNMETKNSRSKPKSASKEQF